jgi:hypothetical protein
LGAGGSRLGGHADGRDDTRPRELARADEPGRRLVWEARSQNDLQNSSAARACAMATGECSPALETHARALTRSPTLRAHAARPTSDAPTPDTRPAAPANTHTHARSPQYVIRWVGPKVDAEEKKSSKVADGARRLGGAHESGSYEWGPHDAATPESRAISCAGLRTCVCAANPLFAKAANCADSLQRGTTAKKRFKSMTHKALWQQVFFVVFFFLLLSFV